MEENHMILPWADDEPTELERAPDDVDIDSRIKAEITDNVLDAMRDIFGPEYLTPDAFFKRQAD